MKKFIAVICCLCLIFVTSCNSLTPAEQAIAEGKIRLPILMYHHMTTNPDYINEYTIPLSEFEDDLRYLYNNGYETINMTQLIDFAYNGTPLPEKPVMITFDDGFYSFYAYAYPLLKDYNMKAVMAIVGQYTDEYTKTGDESVYYAYLGWDKIKEMSDSGLVEIANHTYDMHEAQGARAGCTINKGETYEQYRLSLYSDIGVFQQQIEDIIGKTPNTFAYPFGFASKESVDILKELGFSAALTCVEKVNYIDQNILDKDWLYTLQRINRVGNITSEKFFNKLEKQ